MGCNHKLLCCKLSRPAWRRGLLCTPTYGKESWAQSCKQQCKCKLLILQGASNLLGGGRAPSPTILCTGTLGCSAAHRKHPLRPLCKDTARLLKLTKSHTWLQDPITSRFKDLIQCSLKPIEGLPLISIGIILGPNHSHLKEKCILNKYKKLSYS